MEIIRLQKAGPDALRHINALLKQISSRVKTCSAAQLRSILRSKETELWVIREGKTIVGMGTLALVLRPEGIAARIEDIVIGDGERGKGLGTKLIGKLIERGRARKASLVQLTSNPSRTAANNLYQKMGFVRHETNSYKLEL